MNMVLTFLLKSGAENANAKFYVGPNSMRFRSSLSKSFLLYVLVLTRFLIIVNLDPIAIRILKIDLFNSVNP